MAISSCVDRMHCLVDSCVCRALPFTISVSPEGVMSYGRRVSGPWGMTEPPEGSSRKASAVLTRPLRAVEVGLAGMWKTRPPRAGFMGQVLRQYRMV